MRIPDRSDLNFLDQQQALFTRISRRYDLMNSIMSGWQDSLWRRYTMKRAALPASGRLLDIGTGTGKLALEGAKQYPSSQIIAADLTIPMIELGRSRNPRAGFDWIASETSTLPFPANAFDAVVSAFLVRNLSNVHQGLTEQYRVLKPGGKIAILDTTPKPSGPLSPIIRLYMYYFIPALSRLITGDKESYTYLYDSTMNFLRAEELAIYLASVGFKKVLYRRFMFGMIAVHWAEK